MYCICVNIIDFLKIVKIKCGKVLAARKFRKPSARVFNRHHNCASEVEAQLGCPGKIGERPWAFLLVP
jgi:hypothetical protein